jgi:hypothetical protein
LVEATEALSHDMSKCPRKAREDWEVVVWHALRRKMRLKNRPQLALMSDGHTLLFCGETKGMTVYSS